MTVRRILNPSSRYVGLSTDDKPAVAEGSLFYEYNPAGKLLGVYEYISGEWVLQPDVPDEATNTTNDLLGLILAELQEMRELLAVAINS